MVTCWIKSFSALYRMYWIWLTRFFTLSYSTSGTVCLGWFSNSCNLFFCLMFYKQGTCNLQCRHTVYIVKSNVINKKFYLSARTKAKGTIKSFCNCHIEIWKNNLEIYINSMYFLLQESISTCRFAQRVAMIKNDVLLNEEIDPKLVSWYCLPNQLHKFVDNIKTSLFTLPKCPGVL